MLRCSNEILNTVKRVLGPSYNTSRRTRIVQIMNSTEQGPFWEADFSWSWNFPPFMVLKGTIIVFTRTLHRELRSSEYDCLFLSLGVLGSNIGVETACPHLRFLMFSSALPGKCRYSTSSQTTTAFFRILSNSLFTNHPMNRRCTVELLYLRINHK
jgi:hypothetical protein